MNRVKEIENRSGSYLLILISIIFIIQLLCFPSCSTKPRIPKITINELRTNEKYHLKEVKLTGLVSKSIDIPFVSLEFYKITDGTSEVWIVTEIGSPPKQTKVEVQGILKDGGTEFESFGISAKVFVQQKVKYLD